MALQQYKMLLLVVTVVSALFVASPAVQHLLVVPQTDYLTEFSILGPYQNSTYPYNIASGRNYTLYLDITNRLGSCAYYAVETKFRNETQSAPDTFNSTSSTLPPLGNFSFIVADKQTLELPISVTFNYQLNESGSNRISIQSIMLNNLPLSTTTTLSYDSVKKGFYGNLFFELWIYNDTANTFQYNHRYVSLWLKFN